ncbi:hypothetical protein BGY98DRAFT_999963 [Russula aff. rugulosa BPL654]|nr:hypothetical protein BGY98DRAFT_999963 [Russula aff. rugulosa BPL654]
MITIQKVRDRIKRRDMLAEICLSYELHTKLNLPERQACGLRASQGVQVDVFKVPFFVYYEG